MQARPDLNLNWIVEKPGTLRLQEGQSATALTVVADVAAGDFDIYIGISLVGSCERLDEAKEDAMRRLVELHEIGLTSADEIAEVYEPGTFVNRLAAICSGEQPHDVVIAAAQLMMSAFHHLPDAICLKLQLHIIGVIAGGDAADSDWEFGETVGEA